MPLSPGVRLGAYEIQSALGAGGMGEVYRARDTTLRRDVAIKILPDAFATDPERLARFKREAQTLASLNHPNIAQIYGFENTTSVRALVMELVEGPTLADRLERGRLPLDEALSVARQMVDALGAAHERGVIHRDVKPANIKLRSDGTVKMLDFGLAKLADPMPASTASGSGPAASDDPAVSPTITSPAMTGAGIILGTAAYMAPEQAKGKPVDRRADIWAFGCVLYEMLAGRRAFGGEDVSDTLAEVIKGEPDWTKLPAETPAPIRRLLQRCLVKDRSRRLAEIADARFELEDAQAGVSAQSDTPQAASPRLERLAWAAALVIASGVAAALALFARPPATVPEMRVEIPTPPTIDPSSLAISPDGNRIAFVGATSGRPQLWLRSLDAASAQPLAGTEGATLPFWAPHSRSIGFFADDGRLKRIDLAGGEVRVLANARLPRGGTWNGEDTILFVPGTGPVFRIQADGDEPTQVTRLRPSEPLHAFPSFLPDGEHFIYFVGGDSTTRGIYLAALSAPEGRRLLEVDSPAVFAPPDHLLVVRAGRLLAQRLDPARWDVAGSALPVAESIAMGTVVTRPVAAVSASAGHIAYRSGSASPKRQFVWFDRSGRELERLGDPDEAERMGPNLSRDGRRLAMHRTVNGNVDIWLLETGRGALSRFTSHVANEIHPLWSPDGSRLRFSSNRTGEYALYERSATGPADETLVMAMASKWCTGCTPTDWSPDGRVMLFTRRAATANSDIWILPLAAGEEPFPYVETEFDERDAQFAPDGRWIAYSSTESGRSDVYVRAFPGPGAGMPISINGGAQPRWRPDGKELFFIGLDDRLMAVPVTLPSDGGSFDAGTPVPLFATHVGGAVHPGSRQQYVVSRDGQRFLMNTVVEGTASTSITLIANWRPQEDGPRE